MLFSKKIGATVPVVAAYKTVRKTVFSVKGGLVMKTYTWIFYVRSTNSKISSKILFRIKGTKTDAKKKIIEVLDESSNKAKEVGYISHISGTKNIGNIEENDGVLIGYRIFRFPESSYKQCFYTESIYVYATNLNLRTITKILKMPNHGKTELVPV